MSAKLKKIIIIVIPIVILVNALIIGSILLFKDKEEDESYRSIKVYSIDGEAVVTKPNAETLAPYENMILEADSALRTGKDSRVYLKLDDDKYLMVAPSTNIILYASGTASNSKTTISLDYGEIMIHVTDPLSEASSFEVKTAHSTMAIRGTSFSVSTKTGETSVNVFEGTVDVSILVPNGSVSDTLSLGSGKATTITESNGEVFFEGEPSDIDYNSFDNESLEFLKVAIDEGKDVGLTKDEIDEIIEERGNGTTHLVKFVFTYENGDTVIDTTFATDMVVEGETVKTPILKPTHKGYWDFDFSTPITEDIVIHWVAE